MLYFVVLDATILKNTDPEAQNMQIRNDKYFYGNFESCFPYHISFGFFLSSVRFGPELRRNFSIYLTDSNLNIFIWMLGVGGLSLFKDLSRIRVQNKADTNSVVSSPGSKDLSQDPWVMYACDLYVFIYM